MKGVERDMLAPPPSDQMRRIKAHIPHDLITKPAFEPLIEELQQEVLADYELSLRKAIGEELSENILFLAPRIEMIVPVTWSSHH